MLNKEAERVFLPQQNDGIEYKPRYTHDCNRCVFLGQWMHYDLYCCPSPSSPLNTTVIARYDSEPSHYMSGLGFSLTALIVAEALAKRQNLLPEDNVLKALRTLTRWATHGHKDGNPYGKPEIKQALQVIAHVRGRRDWMDANDDWKSEQQ